MRQKTRVTRTRLAGDHHAVNTLLSSQSLGYRREVCDECPFRLDAKIGEFPAEAYRYSAHTAYDAAMETFACHMSGKDYPKTCAGFLLTQGIHNIGVRLSLSKGAIDLNELRTTEPLYENYRQMAIANGVSPDDPVLQNCRDDAQLKDE